MNFKKKTVIVVLLFLICLISDINKKDLISYGIVEDTSSSYIIVQKYLYKVKVFTKEKYETGSIVYIQGYKTEDTDLLKYNIRFICYDSPKLISINTPLHYINKKINSVDSEYSNYLKKIILNTYDYENELDFVGYGFSFYMLLMFIKRKNKLICLITLIIYILLFRFDIKFYLIIIGYLSDKLKLNRIQSILLKILILLFINRYLILNNSILISLLFSFVYLKDKKDKSMIMLIQSIFFNQISLGLTLFYNIYFFIRILLFLVSIVVLICPVLLGSVYLKLINISSIILKILNFGLRGRITVFGIIVFWLIKTIFKIKSNCLKCILLFLLVLVPINNPLKHINFIDIGQGNATLIHGSFGKYNILIDTGSKYNYSKLKNTLYGEGIYKIDYLIVSHEDEDHSGNVENLKKDFKIEEIIYDGKDIDLDEAYLKYLYLGKYDNDNDNSLVYLLNIDNRQALLPGDASKKVENIIVNKYDVRNIDILDIGHHGSNTSSSSYFIGNLNPEYTVISTNGKYGHPHEETINTLNSYKLDYLITKNEGNIKFYFTDFIDLCITSKRVEIF